MKSEVVLQFSHQAFTDIPVIIATYESLRMKNN